MSVVTIPDSATASKLVRRFVANGLATQERRTSSGNTPMLAELSLFPPECASLRNRRLVFTTGRTGGRVLAPRRLRLHRHPITRATHHSDRAAICLLKRRSRLYDRGAVPHSGWTPETAESWSLLDERIGPSPSDAAARRPHSKPVSSRRWSSSHDGPHYYRDRRRRADTRGVGLRPALSAHDDLRIRTCSSTGAMDPTSHAKSRSTSTGRAR